jgi:transcriptional regulator with XRE-family HTH domain
VTRARNVALGEFLRTRRARVDPYHVGLPVADRRRVPGLRREELAQLAGVSHDYYARLEQGRQATASPSVLDAVADALRLTADERSHLYDLAGVADGTAPPAPPRIVDRGIQRLIDALGDTPVILRGAFSEVIAVNPAGAFLFADFNRMAAPARNGLRWMLLEPRARELYGPGWEDAAAEMTGRLRLEAGRMPADPRGAELAAELSERSELFRRVWGQQHVSSWQHDDKTLYHPGFGSMRFFTELVTAHTSPGQTLVVMMPAQPAVFRSALHAGEPAPQHADR